MTTLEALRVIIRDRMQQVPNIGAVHPYERYAATESALKALYLTQIDGRASLRAWFIRRVTTRETVFSSLRNRVEIDWQLRGFLALEDAMATEIVMDQLVEQLRWVWRRDPTLGGVLDVPVTVGQPIGLQLVESAPYMFAGVLCHGVRLNFTGALFASTEDEPESWGDFRTFHANWDVPVYSDIEPPLPADAASDATDHVTLETDP